MADSASPVRRLRSVLGSSFLFGILAMPSHARSAVAKVYDFCRVTDDETDRDPAAAPGALAGWRREVEATWAGAPGHPVTRALLPVIRRYRLKRDYADLLLEGYGWDAERRRYATWEDLALYCDRVAGAPGLLVLQVLGVHEDPRAREYSGLLSRGLQLGNILRDLGEDLARGRIYLPEEDFAGAGYTTEDLAARKVTREYFALCRLECVRARNLLERAGDVVQADHALQRRMLGPEIMRATYLELLRRLEPRLDDALFGAAPRLGLGTRAMIAGAAWIEVRLGR